MNSSEPTDRRRQFQTGLITHALFGGEEEEEEGAAFRSGEAYVASRVQLESPDAAMEGKKSGKRQVMITKISRGLDDALLKARLNPHLT